MPMPPPSARALGRRERSDKGKRHALPESHLQAACVKYLLQRGLLCVGSAAGSLYANGARTALALRARGVFPGQPDLLVLERGAGGEPGLAVEFKIGTNPLSVEQRAWFQQAGGRGWHCADVRSTTEFHRVLRDYLGRKELPPFDADVVDLDLE